VNLPIDSVLPELKEALGLHTRAVLTAAPGAGKSTRVPLALMDEPWLAGKKLILLEPRRIAARSIAAYMARQLNEPVGGTVGYRVRMDARVGPRTRIEVVTEGVLTRMLQRDPALEDVGAVLFDEFHERSVHADLGLALCLQAQSLLREDLRILVMSATMDAEAVSRLMDDAPVIHSEGRVYPVETRYVSVSENAGIEAATAAGVMTALERESGHVLAFLPGAGEISRVQRQLEDALAGTNVRVYPLHGSLTPEEQDRAVAPPEPNVRKVVLATSIAETSLTVEGVRIVVDSGWSRVPRYSPRTGLTRLDTVRVSLAAAEQRRGRAGRLAPGVCFRLWRREDERQFPAYHPPEILSSDLSALALELAVWGTRDPAELAWLDPPPQAAYAQAVELLRTLGALDARGVITEHGRAIAELGAPPRLAHMLLRSREFGWEETACLLAAMLQERDFMAGSAQAEADLRPRLEALAALCAGRRSGGMRAVSGGAMEINRPRAQRIVELADHLSAMLRNAAGSGERGDRAIDAAGGPNPGNTTDADRACGILLALAYPDRIARRRGQGYVMRNGRGAVLTHDQPLAKEEWLVAAELDDAGTDSRILRAAPIAADDIAKVFADQIAEAAVTAWDPAARAVRAAIRQQLGSIVIREKPNPNPAPEELAQAWLAGLEREGLGILPWTKASRQFQRRNVWMRRVREGWPDLSDEGLMRTAAEWLIPHLDEVRHAGELSRLPLMQLLEGMLTWTERRELDRHAPTHWTVPSGSRIPIDYTPDESPVLAVRLQEMFGAAETPVILNGRVPLTLHLLSPAGRPVQITRDLRSFWERGYFEVKKDLKGRYPKHYWPDDPWQALPTRKARPQT
jgi:ATP-dependent helicase HrpB